MSKNFMTQHGLKIRLDLSYFMRYITGEKGSYSSDEMLDNPIMNNIVSMVEQRYQYPSMLKWYAALIMMIFFPKISVTCYAIILSVVTLFGIIWRVICPDILLNIVINTIEMIYAIISKIWFLPYLIVTIVGFIQNKTFLIVFFVVSLCFHLISLIVINTIISNLTHKKYGYYFNDTEICAFVTFYVIFERTEGLTSFIKEYCSYEKSKEYPNNNSIE